VKLDVVVPTYNRSGLLRRTISSLLQARVPEGLEVTILIADNNSSDDTAQVVREIAAQSSIPVVHVLETRQSSSYARNAGISAGHGEVIGFVDDDEEVDQHWYEVIAREFADPATEFIGGPCLANTSTPLPAWLPPGYNGVIGVIDPKPRAPYGPSFPGNLNSGNAVIRRSVFDRVGQYSPNLGRSGKGLLSEEDVELYRRLIDAGIHGVHVPDLIIYHYIPASRLTRQYHRRWCYWRGVSQGVLAREQKEPVAYALGVPRYKIGRALKGLLSLPGHVLSRRPGNAFANELSLWDLLGFIYGRHFIRIERYYAKS
jgi:glycosyltransferase involved in cell wall biosynthesis